MHSRSFHSPHSALSYGFCAVSVALQDDRSEGEVEVLGIQNLNDLKGKNVLVVEDIIDTGKTMVKLLSLLHARQPKSVRVISLLKKRTSKSCGYQPDCKFPFKLQIGHSACFCGTQTH